MLRTALQCLFIGSVATIAHAEDFPVIEHLPALSLVENFGVRLGGAEEQGAKPLPKLALGLIKDFEGWEPAAYNDPSGYCTIGYGHLIALKKCENSDLSNFKGKVLTEAEGEALLEQDTVYARIAVDKLVDVDLEDHEFGALTAFVFNVGETNFKNSSMLTLINADSKDAAAAQFGRWIKSKGAILTGLKIRRACERTQFEGTSTENSQGRFDRSNCSSYGAVADTTQLLDLNP